MRRIAEDLKARHSRLPGVAVLARLTAARR